MSAVGHADNIPLASNSDPEGRARNRRVAVTILSGIAEPSSEVQAAPVPETPPR
jgi:chemotaxis protein MotB